ncbi:MULTISPECIES: glycerate kinase [Micrococcaceae]|uniref:glycerate kinase n=1 Tax=Micrococcaceae TaxID=1268 RepID=UPI000BB8B554|nr:MULTISPECIES: glycerate kinase [Micrococcaceae]PCC30444.1 glycerate kinase [Glutamicibacter sp. BW80]PCC31727.1 glycerate kinase [Glutamicibacter sp. BW77]PRA04244.1 glycerate kinase [Arthrobacter sp. MYb229]PRB51845.1 glycerate kinase [Arthrobacter sp. MYb216]
MTQRTPAAAQPLNVAIVPDSFKGSARASEVADAIAAGVNAAATSVARTVSITAVPFADGGEGTLDALIDAWGTEAKVVETTDALGRTVNSRFGLSADGTTAVIEAAEAAGLPQVSDVPRQPLQATTFGLGPLVIQALELGVQRIILCLGGSATTDGGAGLLAALGAKFLDAQGKELAAGGGALNDLASIDISGLDSRASRVKWQIACDVTNPLLGENGAAAVFGPQKGASPQEVEALNAGLARLADTLETASGRKLREQPGMGAAGGLALCLGSYCEVELVPGWELVAQALNAHQILADAQLVFTGEGRLDSQSLQGKVVSGVLQAARRDADIIVIAGSVDLAEELLAESGILAAYSIAQGPADLGELSSQALELIRRTAYQVARTYLH